MLKIEDTFIKEQISFREEEPKTGVSIRKIEAERRLDPNK